MQLSLVTFVNSETRTWSRFFSINNRPHRRLATTGCHFLICFDVREIFTGVSQCFTAMQFVRQDRRMSVKSKYPPKKQTRNSRFCQNLMQISSYWTIFVINHVLADICQWILDGLAICKTHQRIARSLVLISRAAKSGQIGGKINF